MVPDADLAPAMVASRDQHFQTSLLAPYVISAMSAILWFLLAGLMHCCVCWLVNLILKQLYCYLLIDDVIRVSRPLKLCRRHSHRPFLRVSRPAEALGC